MPPSPASKLCKPASQVQAQVPVVAEPADIRETNPRESCLPVTSHNQQHFCSPGNIQPLSLPGHLPLDSRRALQTPPDLQQTVSGPCLQQWGKGQPQPASLRTGTSGTETAAQLKMWSRRCECAQCAVKRQKMLFRDLVSPFLNAPSYVLVDPMSSAPTEQSH